MYGIHSPIIHTIELNQPIHRIPLCGKKILPPPSDPFTETALSITVPQEPTVCCYRIVGMTPYISEITPQTVQQDTVVSITINGDHTNWTSDSVILRCDYGITVDSVVSGKRHRTDYADNCK